MEEFLRSYGPWLLFGVLMLFMMRGGGCCGGHSHHRKDDSGHTDANDTKLPE